ncbi:hypothetical protein KI688_001708 [Linnemannia hyalina]|uniref:Uncharacterized protein n=1 Tax=Linnemannia hyalina TaxID=64524 RepID=A0A9P7XVG4_9FUNG|nr:hypothetical protein KI688_001708 [Linnemannia hyalina]
MDTTRNKHPLSIPEIVLTIGKLIPLWVQAHYKGETVWYFRPKDLVAASAVNSLFHTLFTPILRTVFAYPADNSLKKNVESPESCEAVIDGVPAAAIYCIMKSSVVFIDSDSNKDQKPSC